MPRFAANAAPPPAASPSQGICEWPTAPAAICDEDFNFGSPSPLLQQLLPAAVKRARTEEPQDNTSSSYYYHSATHALLVRRVAEKLVQLVQPSDSSSSTPPPLTPHHVDILLMCAYTDADPDRVQRHEAAYGVAVAVVAVEYAERFLVHHRALDGHQSSSFLFFFLHHVLAACFLLAVKQLDDHLPSSQRWAELCRVPQRELAQMELLVCTGLDWRLVVHEQAYAAQFASLFRPSSSSSS